MAHSEVDRIRAAYARRAPHFLRYTPFDPAHLLLHWSRQRAFLGLLKRHGICTLTGLRTLEVGCGAADILLEFLGYGASPADTFGVDVMPESLAEGHDRSPNLRLFCADGQVLPFLDDSFDLVTGYTVFTSVLDNDVRQHIAAEMLRVVKGTGLIVIYDFWPNNPGNADVRGLTLPQLKSLFGDCVYDVRRIVLAPPIARRLASISPQICQLLEIVPWLCSHYLVSVSPSP